MPAIDKLAQRPTFNSTLVKQAMQEARTDEGARAQLQQLVEQRAGDFEDTAQVDHVLQLLTELNKDKFEIVPNRQAGALGKVEVLEARITKVKDEKVRVDITPPPPAPPSYRRDPLNVTGNAAPGSTVEFYNASVPGRPVLGSVNADANGHFSYELTDETKFAFGDQIGVRLVGHDGEKGRPLIVPTEPFLITNRETTYFRRQGGQEVDVRTDHTTSQQALDRKTDDRAPFFQAPKVDRSLEVPSEVEQPYAFTLTGKDDAVEPNSSITVKVGNEEFKTTVDDLGKFALKVRGVAPGQRLAIEVRDINGRGVDIPARVPPIALPAPQLAGAMGPVAEGLRVKVADLVPPGGALIARNVRTGVVSELVADKKGRLDGVLKGIEPFDAFEIAARDVNGHVSEQAELLVHMPKGVVLASTLDAKEPNLAAAFASLCGPPVDVLVNGKPKPGGPFLPLPNLPKLPPYAVLEVVKDGDSGPQVVQALRADDKGKLDGAMLRGVRVGDALSFRLRDAGGRLFPTQVAGFVVPDGGSGAGKVTALVPPSLQPLDAARVGTGTLTLDPEWLAPARVLVGSHAPKDFQEQHKVRSQVGGAIVKQPDAHFMAEQFGKDAQSNAALHHGASLTVTQQAGRKTLTLDTGATPSPHGRDALSFGFDDTLGTLTPTLTAGDLPRLQQALSSALAIVGACYANGLERGDVAYDRALGAAKTLMFLLDRFAIANPGEAGAARAAAQAALAGKGVVGAVAFGKPFALELVPRDVVGHARKEPVESVTSGAMSLLQARTLALGDVKDAGEVGGAALDALDVSALSAGATYDGKTLSFTGAQGAVPAGAELIVKVGDELHRFTADKKGAVTGALPVAPGAIVQMAARVGVTGKEDQADPPASPLAHAVVVAQPILGEGHLVSLDALVQRAPDASAVAEAVVHGGPTTGKGAPTGLPPGGSVVVTKDGKEVARVAIGADGKLPERGAGVKGSAGDLLDVRVLDAAGRPFAPVMKDVVVGQSGSGKARLDVDALSLAGVIEHVGSGALAMPSFPDRKGAYDEREPHEIHASLHPTWGPSSSVEKAHGRFLTKAAFPPGLLPELANPSREQRRLSGGMGDSISLHALQLDAGAIGSGGGPIKIGANYFIDNERPDFAFIIDDRTGEVREEWGRGGDFQVPASLDKLSTLLQTSIAFVAVSQKVGSEPVQPGVPGARSTASTNGMYDLAARTAKATLVVFDRLIQKHPTFRTEILAAMRAALPPSMPFDLAPAGNAPPPAQVAVGDVEPASANAFWSAVYYDDRAKEARDGGARPRTSWGLDIEVPRTSAGAFFGGANRPASGGATPLYLRGR